MKLIFAKVPKDKIVSRGSKSEATRLKVILKVWEVPGVSWCEVPSNWREGHVATALGVIDKRL